MGSNPVFLGCAFYKFKLLARILWKILVDLLNWRFGVQ